jgi:hypothetical protein
LPKGHGAHASLRKPDLKNQASTERWLKSIAQLLAGDSNTAAGGDQDEL